MDNRFFSIHLVNTISNGKRKLKCLKLLSSNKRIGQAKGQVIVEYVLLLVLSTALALLLINLVSVEPGKNTPVFRYWKHLLEVIGNDIST